MFSQEHTKTGKYFFIDLQVNTHCSFLPIIVLFLKGENTKWKNWVVLGVIFLKNHQGKRGRERENTQVVESCRGDGIFLF